MPAPLSPDQIQQRLKNVPGWTIANNELTRTFKFKNYHQSMAFVNATAWISHQADHHPDIDLGYDTVKMRYSTHSAGGLTESDFQCAARVNGLQADQKMS
jgi:4a-hydroxytetrahydrobiopterin dehydratase